MRFHPSIQNVLIGATAALFAGVKFIPGTDESGPVLRKATSFVTGSASATVNANEAPGLAAKTTAALNAFSSAVRPLSHPRALETAFHAYFAYKAEHPNRVRKPYLYFVDYGLPSTERRGYVFDMSSLSIVEGPFTVAHGRGSSKGRLGIPTRFSNAFNSAATSLGLYLAQEVYDFRGHSGGRAYSAVGMRMMGLSTDYNDNARARRVVAHGAPYVTAAIAGRSEGCPAMEPARAKRLLPKLGNGGMVFLFAPNSDWLAGDPWIAERDGL
jgi:hypothetical protein